MIDAALSIIVIVVIALAVPVDVGALSRSPEVTRRRLWASANGRTAR
jgi:hypothetical protein